MSFNSLEFLLFISLDLLIYYFISEKYKNIFLLVSSYLFYLYSGVKNTAVLFLYSLLIYLLGKFISISFNNKKSLFLTIFGVSISLLILIYYKYSLLFFELLKQIQIGSNVEIENIIAPLGISFYVFQAISYLLDVYKRKINAEESFVDFFLYLSFFPKLIVGPIEENNQYISQIKNKRIFNWKQFYIGIIYCLWGLFLKLVVADRAGLFVDAIFVDYKTYNGFYCVVASLLYSFQIYADFSGYSFLAVGVGKILGFELTKNFNAPYLTNSVNDFWKNWHITLTSWFRKYVYIPLGGNKKGKLRKFVNKMIVFILSGLWHGSSITFVIWGILNGLYVIIEETLNPIQIRIEKKFNINKESQLYKLLCNVRMFVLISFSWIFFRSKTISDAFGFINSLFALNNLNIFFDFSIFSNDLGLGAKNFLLLAIAIIVLLIVDYFGKRGISIAEKIFNLNFIIRGVVIAFISLFIILFGKYGPNLDISSFIYMGF